MLFGLAYDTYRVEGRVEVPQVGRQSDGKPDAASDGLRLQQQQRHTHTQKKNTAHKPQVRLASKGTINRGINNNSSRCSRQETTVTKTRYIIILTVSA